mgnify:CR=1 FL=1
MSDAHASSIYDSFNTSPYLRNVSNGTNGEKGAGFRFDEKPAVFSSLRGAVF